MSTVKKKKKRIFTHEPKGVRSVLICPHTRLERHLGNIRRPIQFVRV